MNPEKIFKISIEEKDEAKKYDVRLTFELQVPMTDEQFKKICV